jgi:hypothetical protein
MPGYSGKPLADKLGFKPGVTVATLGAPKDYSAIVSPLPAGARLVTRVPAKPVRVHLFATKRADLEKHLKSLRKRLAQDGMVWVSWPKKSSGMPTNITEDTIREVALPMGYVDIKVCAVTDVWSGLKLVIRKIERGK